MASKVVGTAIRCLQVISRKAQHIYEVFGNAVLINILTLTNDLRKWHELIYVQLCSCTGFSLCGMGFNNAGNNNAKKNNYFEITSTHQTSF